MAVAGAGFGEVGASLFVAGALFGGILGMAGARNDVFLHAKASRLRER